MNANELTNGVINAAFMLLFKDAIRLFAAYNEGIINLLGKDKLLLLAHAGFTLRLFGRYGAIKRRIAVAFVRCGRQRNILT